MALVPFHHAVKKPSLRSLSFSKPSYAAFGLPQSRAVGGRGGGGGERLVALAASSAQLLAFTEALVPSVPLVPLPSAVQLLPSLPLAALALRPTEARESLACRLLPRFSA